jgi:hypothetical protein
VSESGVLRVRASKLEQPEILSRAGLREGLLRRAIGQAVGADIIAPSDLSPATHSACWTAGFAETNITRNQLDERLGHLLDGRADLDAVAELWRLRRSSGLKIIGEAAAVSSPDLDTLVQSTARP